MQYAFCSVISSRLQERRAAINDRAFSLCSSFLDIQKTRQRSSELRPLNHCYFYVQYFEYYQLITCDRTIHKLAFSNLGFEHEKPFWVSDAFNEGQLLQRPVIYSKKSTAIWSESFAMRRGRRIARAVVRIPSRPVDASPQVKTYSQRFWHRVSLPSFQQFLIIFFIRKFDFDKSS